MYGIAGERRLDERELDWLPGFENSGPVRIGNAASGQLQLDVYGELLEAVYLSIRHGIEAPLRMVATSGTCSLARRRMATRRMPVSGRCEAQNVTLPTPK